MSGTKLDGATQGRMRAEWTIAVLNIDKQRGPMYEQEQWDTTRVN